MKKFLLSLAVLALSASAHAETVVDELTIGSFGTWTNTENYQNVSYTSTTSGITYIGQMAKATDTNGAGIQIRSKNSNSGLVISANSKDVVFKSIEFTYANGKNTINVYGKATAYTAASNLYTGQTDTDQGTKIGSVNATGTVSAEAGSNYKFIGFRSNSGAIYLTKITITYDIPAQSTKEPADLKFSETSFTITKGDDFEAPTLTKATTAEVSYATSDDKIADVDQTSGVVTINGVGIVTITATTPANDDYDAGEASYTINVLDPNVAYTNTCLTEDNGFTASYEGTNPWKISSQYGLVANGYINGSRNATDAYMVSPVIDLTNRKNCHMSFDHAINYFNPLSSATQYIEVVAREEGTTEWTKLSEPTLPTTKNEFVPSGEISLAAFDGKKIQIGFHYTSTTTDAGAWEIKNVNVLGEKQSTGIDKEITAEGAAAGAIYDLQGRKVVAPAKGIFIVNGKKVRL